MPDGVLLVDKAAGITSHDVVARVRREHGRSVKVGHAGTLDPFATGLLLVLLGRATRIQRFLMGLPKSYETTARLGWTSTTGDVDGELARGRTPASLELPVGIVRQTPPAFSAIKVRGRRAYSYARAGEEVEIPEREVEVYRAQLLSHDRDRASYEIECSAGTYIRSLVMDLGDAYCEALRRTRIGDFDVERAGEFVALADALAFLPEVRLDPDAARRAAHGVPVAPTEGPARGDHPGQDPRSTVRLVDGEGLIALAEPREDGTLKPIVGFRG